MQLIMDEPGPPVARIRVSHSNDRGPVGQMIWASILILAVNFGRVVTAYVAMNSQKAHDEVTKQPHVAGRHRPGVGSDTEGKPAVGIKGSRVGSISEEDLCLRQEGPGHPEDEAPRQHGWQNWQLAFVCDCPGHDLDQRWRV